MNQAVQEHNQLLLSAIVSNRVGISPSLPPTSTPTEATAAQFSITTIVVAVVVVVIVAMVLATVIIIVALRNRHSTVDLTKDSR